MNLDNLPNQFKQLLQNRELSMNQKMVTLMAFMPDIPNMPPAENCDELGTTIKDLIKKGKIRLDGFDKDFKLKINEL
jgi:hypothetical protein